MDGMGSFANIFKDQREHMLLKEQSFGLFDGLSKEERQELYPKEQMLYEKYANNKGKFYAPMPCGESQYDVANRICQFFGTVNRDAGKTKGMPRMFLLYLMERQFGRLL